MQPHAKTEFGKGSHKKFSRIIKVKKERKYSTFNAFKQEQSLIIIYV